MISCCLQLMAFSSARVPATATLTLHSRSYSLALSVAASLSQLLWAAGSDLRQLIPRMIDLLYRYPRRRRWRGYCDHFITMCVCGCVCVGVFVYVSTIKWKPLISDLRLSTVIVLNTMLKPIDLGIKRSRVRGTGSSFELTAPAAT